MGAWRVKGRKRKGVGARDGSACCARYGIPPHYVGWVAPTQRLLPRGPPNHPHLITFPTPQSAKRLDADWHAKIESEDHSGDKEAFADRLHELEAKVCGCGCGGRG